MSGGHVFASHARFCFCPVVVQCCGCCDESNDLRLRRGICGDDVEEFIQRRAMAIATAHAAVVEDDAAGLQQLSASASAAARMRDLQVCRLILMGTMNVVNSCDHVTCISSSFIASL